MAFKKTCFKCGIKTEKLYNNLCEKCFKKEFPPIKEIKPINIRYCNMCFKLYIGNSIVEKEEFIERLPYLVKKNLILNEKYKLNKLFIEDLEIKGNKISFEIIVDCDLK